MDFGARVSVLAAVYQKTISGVIESAVSDLAHRVIIRTPVDTGNARRNWERSRDGDTFFILNPLNKTPYIRRLEYDGHSPQAPQGMVRISAAEWPAIVRRAVRINVK